VFWNMTAIPAMVVGVPPLLRAVRPLYGRSSILQYEPGWPSSLGGRQTMTGVGFGVLFLAVGFAFIALDASSTTTWPGLELYTAVAAAIIMVSAPIASIVAGTRLQAKPTAG
jgi:hypothetical protein